MREIFAPQPAPDTGEERVFYTITKADIGKRFIETDIGKISLDFMGNVLSCDVGKRIYGQSQQPVPGALRRWYWSVENDEQRDRRLSGYDDAE